MKLGKNIGTQSAIENLISREYTSPVISMYIPTDPVWHNNDRSQIELKNTINKVKEFMEDKTNMSNTEISDLLDPIEDTHNNADFWKSKNEGMAIFKSKDHFEVIDLPVSFEPQFYVSEFPNIKPMLKYLFESEDYYVLAIDYFNVELYKGKNKDWEKLDPLVLPDEIDEIRRTHDVEKQIQSHTATGTANTPAPQRSMHGHGEQDAARDNQMKVFINEIDSALIKYIGDIEDDKNPKVILACDVDLFKKYKDYTNYQNIADDYIKGSPQNIDDVELMEKAWEIIHSKNEKEYEELINSYKNVRDTDKAVSGLEDVVPNTHEGKVEVLILNPDQTKYGTYDIPKGTVLIDTKQKPDNIDLINYAALQTLENSGKVVPLKNGEQIKEEVAAILRY